MADMKLKRLAESILPLWFQTRIIEYITVKKMARYRNMPLKETFQIVYRDGLWGRSNDPNERFISGAGSLDDAAVRAYIDALTDVFGIIPSKPSVVDLGCGDFRVGAQIRQLFGKYIACDIVDDLIEYNKTKYLELDVDFRVLDMTEEPLPKADIVLVRQVFQHLSNAYIQKVLGKLIQYKYLVVTEHLPFDQLFPHNIDKEAGPHIRGSMNSGIVLTSEPFNMKPHKITTLCEVPHYGGRLTTILYEL